MASYSCASSTCHSANSAALYPSQSLLVTSKVVLQFLMILSLQ